MRKMALTLGALGFIAFAGLANADEKSTSTENSVKTESGTTISGKHKNVKTKKMVNADGTTTETKSETIAPKSDKRDVETRDNGVAPARSDDKSNVDEKTEEHTTLTGKKQMKSTKKAERSDGTTTETTTTTTEPKKK